MIEHQSHRPLHRPRPRPRAGGIDHQRRRTGGATSERVPDVAHVQVRKV